LNASDRSPNSKRCPQCNLEIDIRLSKCPSCRLEFPYLPTVDDDFENSSALGFYHMPSIVLGAINVLSQLLMPYVIPVFMKGYDTGAAAGASFIVFCFMAYVFGLLLAAVAIFFQLDAKKQAIKENRKLPLPYAYIFAALALLAQPVVVAIRIAR